MNQMQYEPGIHICKSKAMIPLLRCLLVLTKNSFYRRIKRPWLRCCSTWPLSSCSSGFVLLLEIWPFLWALPPPVFVFGLGPESFLFQSITNLSKLVLFASVYHWLVSVDSNSFWFDQGGKKFLACTRDLQFPKSYENHCNEVTEAWYLIMWKKNPTQSHTFLLFYLLWCWLYTFSNSFFVFSTILSS